MTFVSLPNAGQSLGETRAQVKTNFDDLRSQAAINHYDVNDVNVGKHKMSNYVEQAAAPTVAGNELAIFSKLVASVPQLFTVDSAAVQRQLTGLFTNAQEGAATIYGGIQIRWGQCVDDTTKSFVTPFSTSCWVVITNQYGALSSNAAASSVVSYDVNGFQTKTGTSASARTRFYLAIGY